jgi:hypothetical protein
MIIAEKVVAIGAVAAEALKAAGNFARKQQEQPYAHRMWLFLLLNTSIDLIPL